MGTPARAQLSAAPQSLSATVPQDETETLTATLTNTGSEALTFCVSFDRPLQRVEGMARVAGGNEPCGPYGEVLYRYDDEDFGAAWDPYGITTTPDGRLFTAEGSGLHRTFEFTPDLTLVRFFEHPHIAELTPFSATTGITYDTESGTLWWVNIENTAVGNEIVTRRVLFLEGDLDGEETGRRIEIVPPDTPLRDFGSGGLSYESATELFYFLGISDMDDPGTRELWAVDRTGTLAEGYPLRPEPYPLPAAHGVPDVHGGAKGRPEGVRVEFAVYPSFDAPGFDRIVVVDRWGNSEGEALETPVPAVLFEDGGSGPKANPLRSRIDPNGVMYMTFTSFEREGIVGVRPHPLPPSWLVVDSEAGPEAAWDGTLAPGESREIALTFRPGARAVGTYTATLQAFTAETGEAVEVPLTLEVTEGTVSEEESAEVLSSSLSVYPNPFSREATVALTLDATSEVRVVVYDVLGRRVAVLAEGHREAGTHRFRLDGAGLPAGVYLVRGEAGGQRLSERVTVAR